MKGSLGIRVICLAINDVDSLDNMIFLGLLFIKDDIRDDAIKGIELVHKAHIQTVMITGDNKDTALSIAREVGIVTSKDDIVLTSSELNMMSDDDIKGILPRLRVVARSLPSDKSRLVRLSQELDLVVGMTGHGVNDAPALNMLIYRIVYSNKLGFLCIYCRATRWVFTNLRWYLVFAPVVVIFVFSAREKVLSI